MAWFYEIRNSNNAVLKRDGGFATQDAGRVARALLLNFGCPVLRIL